MGEVPHLASDVLGGKKITKSKSPIDSQSQLWEKKVLISPFLV